MTQIHNDIAIKLTKAIYDKLHLDICALKENSGKELPTHIPSYYNVRETIYTILVEHISVLHQSVEESKIRDPKPPAMQQDYYNHLMEKSAMNIGQMLIKDKEKHMKILEYSNDFVHNRELYVAVFNLGELK